MPSGSYYNEFDPQKAEWLRELIKCGLIAPGDVDERSIVDVRPNDLARYTQCHFFAGIGIWSYALRLAGWPDDQEVWTGSCPCQPFSTAGKGEAFNDERHLWPEFFRLIAARRPVVCFGEQVASIDGLAWFDAVHSDLEHADYTCGALDLCAAGFGAPHRRQRLYWVASNGRMAYSGSERRQQDARSTSANEAEDGGTGRIWRGSSSNHQSCGNGKNGGMAHTAEARRAGTREQAPGRDESADRAGERSEVERMENSKGRYLDQDSGRAATRGIGTYGEPRRRGPVNGFWAGADWVLTRPQRVGDAPGLRPVKPGAFPLAHGIAGRVGLLRGAGDGIVAPQAAAFLRAVMETL